LYLFGAGFGLHFLRFMKARIRKFEKEEFKKYIAVALAVFTGGEALFYSQYTLCRCHGVG
jgi:hypothetical protein